MISRCSHDLLVDTISEMEHCITKIGTEVDFCQVAFFVSSWENMPLIFQKNISGSKHVICQHFSGPPGYSFLLQEWPKCLLQPCRGATKDQTSSPPPMLQNESDLSGILAPNIKVEAILTVQKAELRTATETVNTVICSNNIS